MVDIKKLTKKRVGELLREEGIIGEKEIEEALDKQQDSGDLLGKVLIDLGHTSEQEITNVICKQFGLPYINATNYFPSEEAASKLSVDFIKDKRVVPLDLIGEVLVVAVSCFFHESLFKELEERVDCEIQPMVTRDELMDEAIENCLKNRDEAATSSEDDEETLESQSALEEIEEMMEEEEGEAEEELEEISAPASHEAESSLESSEEDADSLETLSGSSTGESMGSEEFESMDEPSLETGADAESSGEDEDIQAQESQDTDDSSGSESDEIDRESPSPEGRDDTEEKEEEEGKEKDEKDQKKKGKDGGDDAGDTSVFDWFFSKE